MKYKIHNINFSYNDWYLCPFLFLKSFWTNKSSYTISVSSVQKITSLKWRREHGNKSRLMKARHTLLKKLIILTNFVMNFFCKKYLKILLWFFLQEIAVNFLQNILYKILFTTNFVKNTWKFYNFVINNYPRRN